MLYFRQDARKCDQHMTFKKWVNMHLAKSKTKVRIDDLTTDLSDGWKLVILLKCLSGKSIAGGNLKPKTRKLKIENMEKIFKSVNSFQLGEVKGIGNLFSYINCSV